MKMTVTESDKKLLSYLMAFLTAIVFIMFVFRPLLTKINTVQRELSQARVETKSFDKKLQDRDAMLREESELQERSKVVLARFYPMLQSQDAEKMATILMLNHHLQIQSIQVSMQESAEKMKWYPYAVQEEAAEDGMEEEEPENMQLYTARVSCVTDGSKEDLWALVDDLSMNYPAISISSMEWSVSETIEEVPTNSSDEEDEEGNEMEELTVAKTVKTDRLSINLEILMCNQ